LNSLNVALKQFEATAANLYKAEQLWKEIRASIPETIVFGDPAEGLYDDRCSAFQALQESLPKIDGWSLPVWNLELDAIAQMRFDAQEIDMIESKIAVEAPIFEPDRSLKEYRYRFNKKRRALVRKELLACIDRVDSLIRELAALYPEDYSEKHQPVDEHIWKRLIEQVTSIDMLLGNSMKRPGRWQYLNRHLHFGLVVDFFDIKEMDWPAVKFGITQSLYENDEPLPIEAKDLGDLVTSDLSGDVVTALKWESLNEDGFERLLFSLISRTPRYENPEWLTRTNAPDKGRDLSVYRIIDDPLGGIRRHRVIIQCKHWLTKSVGLPDVGSAKDQMSIWEPPLVDVLTIATSGRFTTDAIDFVEKHNQRHGGPRIEMWAENHLEKLLASRPALIGEFGLR